MRTQSDGETIRRLREEMGLTIKQLSERSGISHAYLCRLENEERHGSIVMRRKLASALGTTAAQISKPVPRPEKAAA